MLFGIDDCENVIHIAKDNEYGQGNNGYVFKPVILATEEEMFRDFRKRKNIAESKMRVEQGSSFDIDDDLDDLDMMPIPANSSTGLKRRYAKMKKAQVQTHYHRFPSSGCYIIPKMFGYFPFLDCDDINTYNEATFQLCADNIPYISYNSNPGADSHWIFCDRQGTFEETIKFIESYPSDHRYAWIAKMKGEMCVRAIPKQAGCPKYIETHLKDELSMDFVYFMDRFTDYWNDGLIPKYIDMLKTVDAI